MPVRPTHFDGHHILAVRSKKTPAQAECRPPAGRRRNGLSGGGMRLMFGGSFAALSPQWQQSTDFRGKGAYVVDTDEEVGSLFLWRSPVIIKAFADHQMG